MNYEAHDLRWLDVKFRIQPGKEIIMHRDTPRDLLVLQRFAVTNLVYRVNGISTTVHCYMNALIYVPIYNFSCLLL